MSGILTFVVPSLVCAAAHAPRSLVRMQAATATEMKGIVVSAPVDSWYDSGARLTAPAPSEPATSEPATQPAAALLQRYMQLRNVLPTAEGLSDEVVEELLRRVEAQADASVAFEDEKIQGEWQLVYQRNAKKATNSQKALTGLPAFANFMRAEDGTKIFRNLVTVSSRVTVVADVAYTQPDSDQPEGRLGSVIDGGVVEVILGRRFGWKPLRVPLPIKGVGWLDVTYLSDTMRVTRGNRGGVFVHLRPELITREAAEASR